MRGSGKVHFPAERTPLFLTRADKFKDQFEGAVCPLEDAER